MNVSKSVILDLQPVYLAGDASPETRALVSKHPRPRATEPEAFLLQFDLLDLGHKPVVVVG